jgi:conjugal transfer/entry exclusion protein
MEEAMKKRYMKRLPIVAAAFITAPAYAGIPVFDVLNFASNVAQNVQLTMIKHSLTRQSEGTVVYYNKKIDKSTENIDNSTHNIDNSTKNIDNSTHKSWEIDVRNIEINNDFTWIINKGGDEIIPIPEDLKKSLAAIHGGGVEKYKANFKDASAYAGDLSDHDPKEIFEGSRALKAANDMLVESIEMEQAGMADEASALNELREKTMKAEGHGHQLQVSNSLAAAQINQMMKLRNSMLVTEAQRAAEAQVEADKEARAIAVAKKMRTGLARAMASSTPLSSAP